MSNHQPMPEQSAKANRGYSALTFRLLGDDTGPCDPPTSWDEAQLLQANVMSHFRCSPEAAGRFIELRHEGRTVKEAAAVAKVSGG